jgi:resuscitation-promoting factor RpfA
VTADDECGADDADAREHRDDELDELIHRADLDALVRMIDDRGAQRDWPGLLRVRDRARHAVETGRQLWPAATLAEYRLALHGPAPFVARVLDESDGLSGRFAIGPLSEVAAQAHSWSELSTVVDRGPRAAFVVHERVLRGEDVGSPDVPPVLELPLRLEAWEPRYALATYSDEGAEFPMPTLPDRWSTIAPDPGARRLRDDDVDMAIRQLVEPWTVGSNGQVENVCVEADVEGALGALGVRHARAVELEPADAIAWLAWAGASGGAHARRRGAASGRFGAWWVLAALDASLEHWPLDADSVGDIASSLRWYRWDAYEPAVGWTLQLAIEDPDEGCAWAINAVDAV